MSPMKLASHTHNPKLTSNLASRWISKLLLLLLLLRRSLFTRLLLNRHLQYTAHSFDGTTLYKKQILLSVLFCVRLCKWIELNTQWASTKMFSRIWRVSNNAWSLKKTSWLLIIFWFYYSRFCVYWVPPISMNNNWLDNYRISRAAATF